MTTTADNRAISTEQSPGNRQSAIDAASRTVKRLNEEYGPKGHGCNIRFKEHHEG